jgi:CVNH domain
MRKTLGAFTALLLVGGISAEPAHAQAAPQGSYLNSCTHVGIEGDRLFADCRRTDGAWQRTVLDIDRCAGDIANLNGRLSCNRDAREGYGSSARGDWREGYGSSRREEWRGEQRAHCSGIIDAYERERCWRGW